MYKPDHSEKEEDMPDRFSSLNRPVRLFLLLSLLFFVAGTLLPESVVVASPAAAPQASSEYTGLSNTSLTHDYLKLKAMYVRKKGEVKPLSKGYMKLLNNYKTLQNRGNKNWVAMRVVFYDYNSAYQAAISHKYEVDVLLQEHFGFGKNGKVTNQYLARVTVFKLRGAVVAMISNINKCNTILQKGNQLMKANAVKDGKKKKK
jgi:hypothetical protein